MKSAFVFVLGYASASLSKNQLLHNKLLALSEVISDFEATDLETRKIVQVSQLINAQSETKVDENKKDQAAEPPKKPEILENMDPLKTITEDDKKKALEFKKQAKTYHDYYKAQRKEAEEKVNNTEGDEKKVAEEQLDEIQKVYDEAHEIHIKANRWKDYLISDEASHQKIQPIFVSWQKASKNRDDAQKFLNEIPDGEDVTEAKKTYLAAQDEYEKVNLQLKKACQDSKKIRLAKSIPLDIKVQASPKALIWVAIGSILTIIGAIATCIIYKKPDEPKKEGGVAEVKKIYKRQVSSNNAFIKYKNTDNNNV